jgi:hypothetical protein
VGLVENRDSEGRVKRRLAFLVALPFVMVVGVGVALGYAVAKGSL